MKTIWKAAAALALASLLGVPVLAQELQRVEEKRLALRLEKADASKVLAHLARTLDAQLEYRCERPALVTIAFEGLTPQTALMAICESAGLQWQMVEGPPRILKVTCAAAPPPPPEGGQRVEVKVRKEVDAQGGEVTQEVALQLKDAKLDDVMKLAAELMEARLLMDVALGDKTVTLDVEKAPLTQVLDTLCAQAGATWTLVPGTPPTLKVDPK